MSNTTPPGGRHPGADGLRRTAEEARDAAGERLDSVRRKAWETAGEARHQVEEEAERGKRAGAGEVHRWASALDRAASELGRDSAQGELVHKAAESLDDIARSIEGRSIGQMVDAVSEFGRRNPAAFIGGAMLAGFALSRFATASRPEPEPEPRGYRPSPPAPASRPTAPSTSAPTASPVSPPSPGSAVRAGGPSASGASTSPGSATGSGSPGAGVTRPNPVASPRLGSQGSDDGHDTPLTLTGGMRSGQTGPGTGPSTPPGSASSVPPFQNRDKDEEDDK